MFQKCGYMKKNIKPILNKEEPAIEFATRWRKLPMADMPTDKLMEME
jgi:hypothetical protein